MSRGCIIGLDVGSTTVKAVALDANSRQVLWKDYQKHETRQVEKSLELLRTLEREVPEPVLAAVCTGSGGSPIAEAIGAIFVQEVNAVCLAVRARHPDVRSVVELGGQDAKIVVFREDPATGEISSIPSMNDKCASGTGATIEKIARKVGVRFEQLGSKHYLPFRDDLVHVAAKCGVFAEADVVGHLKSGLPEDQILASLFESIVAQNLAVLTRGRTLLPRVLLLGGPNAFIPGLVEAWRENIPRVWAERGVEAPDEPLEQLIQVPEDAQYFAALGAAATPLQEGFSLDRDSAYRGAGALADYLARRGSEPVDTSVQGLWSSPGELEEFLDQYFRSTFRPATFSRQTVIEGYIGVDGGSTSTKAVLLDPEGRVLSKAYTISEGNPIRDTKDCLAQIREHVNGFGARLEVLGVGTTGYAKDILSKVIGADAAVVETVAHTMSARQLYPETDVIVDVGGQDIKLIMLRDGRVADFRLNAQCSAGNGYFLQSTADAFGIELEKYAETAFQARQMPSFGYGCAVFMQSDIVNFQKEGWTPSEIMAGLAAVLPKNIWLYIAKIPNLAALGETFVLQGGTQYNLAAVKSQVDFIRGRFEGSGVTPTIIVHEHCGEAGAIGAALEAMRVVSRRETTSFIGTRAVESIQYQRTSDERTRCHFCKNHCSRTFVDVQTRRVESEASYESRVPLEAGWSRIITGFSCDRGTVESEEAMKAIKAGMDSQLDRTPNTVQEMASQAFRSRKVEPALPVLRGWNRVRHHNSTRSRITRRERRKSIRIGIPKALNLYSQAPFFLGYFQSLGLPRHHVEFSQTTNAEMFREGAKRGSIDPCFPSKVSLAHVHDLLTRIHAKKPLDYIFFPMVDSFPTYLKGVNASRACPTVTATPEAVKAAFTSEGNVFEQAGIRYLNPLLNLDHHALLREQMIQCLGEALDLDPFENDFAVAEGLKALDAFQRGLRARGGKIIQDLEKDGRLGMVVLARPYHNDEGINHEILLKLQRLGYPILGIESLPTDLEFLDPLFESDLGDGRITDPREIGDVWEAGYSENTSRKIWAAKVVARHPNLVALELSNFKCGHDATCYAVIERIVATSGTPYFTFRDLDENDPGGAINIRLETIDYFLAREREKLFGSPTPITGVQPEVLRRVGELIQFRATQGTSTLDQHQICKSEAHAERQGLIQLSV